MCHLGETHEQFKYDLIKDNLHIDFENIPDDQKSLADPEKWLKSDEKDDWKKADEKITRNFTSDELAFRSR